MYVDIERSSSTIQYTEHPPMSNEPRTLVCICVGHLGFRQNERRGYVAVKWTPQLGLR